MDMLRALNDAAAYIERNLCAGLKLDEAARIAGITADSFQRFFSYMTGMTLKEYVRRRRLTLAAEELRCGRERIIDIAVKYGYDSADAFSRAFARQHGITPSEFRKNGGSLKVYPPVSFHIMIKGAKEMNFRLVELEETTVYGISENYDTQIYPTREALRHRMWSEECEAIPDKICSGSWNHPTDRSRDGVWYGVWRDGRYMIGRESEGDKKGLEKLTLPAGTYAAFTTERGGLAWEEFPKLFGLIFDSWLPDSGYELLNDDIIEVYHLWTDHDLRKKNRYYEVWVPVKKK